MSWTRRNLLHAAMATGLVGLPATARAARPVDRRFIFVWARGGWDATRFTAPMFSSSSVAMEPDATEGRFGDLVFVDHHERPSVRRLFERYGSRTAILDGMLVRSVNHRVCERIVGTGGSQRGVPDWSTRLGAEWGSRVPLPSVVLDGPTSPGQLHQYSSLFGNSDQFGKLLDGRIYRGTDQVVLTPRPESRALLDAFMKQRIAGRLRSHPADKRMLDAYEDGLDRITRFRDTIGGERLMGSTLWTQMETAVRLFELDTSRCAAVAVSEFDTHSNNHLQSGLLESFFEHVGSLVELLEATPGTDGGSMLDETVVVVLSEMGRTPFENVTFGKDHWPYTPVILIGAGVEGGQRVGGYDEHFNGQPVDGVVVTPRELGATLLELGGVPTEGAIGRVIA